MSHDSMPCSSAVAKDTIPRLFNNGCTTSEMAELTVSCASVEQQPFFKWRLKILLQQQKQNKNITTHLNQLLLGSLFPLHIQRLFKFQLPITCLPNVNSLIDVGYIVRRLLLKWHSSNILYKLYQYSMPFIKHNRLNFPSLRNLDMTVLKHMTQAIFLTCLGMHHNDCKKPIWQITHKLFIFFNALMSTGSAADLYVFCEKHVYLLRLALIEHFVAFTNKNMQIEVFLMPFFVDAAYQHNKVSKQLQYIIDTFRQSTMQNDELCWDLVECKAQQAIERCNRTCKAMPNFKTVTSTSQITVWNRDVMQVALQQQPLSTYDLLRQNKATDVLALAQMFKLHSKIVKYPLPVHLQKRQHRQILQSCENNMRTSLLLKTNVFICMQCNTTAPSASKDMRYHFQHEGICTYCLSKDFVLKVQTLGHLLRVNQHYYYFCEFCQCVHLWQSLGREFCACNVATAVGHKVSKHCAICFRTMHLFNVKMLDKRLGIMTQLYLCSKHMPAQNKLVYAHDLTSLRKLIEFDSH